MALTHAEIKNQLIAICNEVGWPVPTAGLSAWSLGSIQTGPSCQLGSDKWQNAHRELVAAYEAVLREDWVGVRIRLQQAKEKLK